jgi:maltooligosyltrehalose synthase
MDAIRNGAAPTAATRKLWLIVKALELRARAADAFAGGYEALDAPDGVCAFRRGDDVFVAVAAREDWSGEPPVPEGEWVDVLDGGFDWRRDGLALRARAAR